MTSELTGTDPIFSSYCAFGLRYDAYTFEHPGGPLSLAARGVDSGGGTYPSPTVGLFSGGVPSDFCSTARIAVNGYGGCGRDAYLEFGDLAAGTYTAVVTGSGLGTYTFERNTFTGPEVCPA